MIVAYRGKLNGVKNFSMERLDDTVIKDISFSVKYGKTMKHDTPINSVTNDFDLSPIILSSVITQPGMSGS
jgi:hypothetical protein